MIGLLEGKAENTMLLRNGANKVDPTNTAAALNYAVLKLREDPKMMLDRWALFVHFGI